MEPMYDGEPILAVAAVDELTAAEAIEKIQIEFEPLPFVVDPLVSLRPDGANARTQGNVWMRPPATASTHAGPWQSWRRARPRPLRRRQRLRRQPQTLKAAAPVPPARERRSPRPPLPPARRRRRSLRRPAPRRRQGSGGSRRVPRPPRQPHRPVRSPRVQVEG